MIGVDLVPERLERARLHGADVLDLGEFDEDQKLISEAIGDLTGGGPDAVIDAVGMEAHGSGGAKFAQTMTGMMPDKVAEKMMEHVGVDRLAALQLAIDVVRRGGTISLSGVYGGMSDPLPMMVMFDKQIQLRMGQANVKRWVDDILPLLTDATCSGWRTSRRTTCRSARPEGVPELPAEDRRHGQGALPASLRPNASSVSPARGGEVGAPVGHAVVGDHVGVEAGL